MSKCNADRQSEWHERQTILNCEEYRKEIKQINAYEVKQNPINFKKKHRETTRKWKENKITDTESNFNDQTLSQIATNSPGIA